MAAVEDIEPDFKELELGLNVPEGFGAMGIAFWPKEVAEKEPIPCLESGGCDVFPGNDK